MSSRPFVQNKKYEVLPFIRIALIFIGTHESRQRLDFFGLLTFLHACSSEHKATAPVGDLQLRCFILSACETAQFHLDSLERIRSLPALKFPLVEYFPTFYFFS